MKPLKTLARKGTVLRRDPSQTFGIRKSFEREMRKRFNLLAKKIEEAVLAFDVLGLNVERDAEKARQVLKIHRPLKIHLQKRQFAFLTVEQKQKKFMQWLETEMENILEVIDGPSFGLEAAIKKSWMNKYIDSGYKKGLERAYSEMEWAGVIPKEPRAIESAFLSPIHAERVGLIYSRAYNDLAGITKQMSAGISRTLGQGMAEGKHPRSIAREMRQYVTPVKIGGKRMLSARKRAEMIARTETVRAHHVANVNSYKAAGLVLGKVMAEWKATPDDRVCEECAALDGKIFKLEKAEGMIPVHPNCRCVLLPANIGEHLADERKGVAEMQQWREDHGN
jgi:SPP1 gp7 family putative phage head morphogenesis protein